MNDPKSVAKSNLCKEFGADELQAAIAGELPEQRSNLLAEHIDECEVCRWQFQKLMWLDSGFRAKGESIDDPERSRIQSLLSRIKAFPEQIERLAPGQLIGRYEVVSTIGRGGFSVVYECEDRTLGRRVAVKVIGEQNLSLSWTFRQDREARLLARLDHPGIVRVFEYGDSDIRPYLVMELVAGGPSNRLFERGPVEQRLAARLVADVARALQHAHSMGVLHRDIKPSNLLVVQNFDRKGPIPADVALKISDFGLARPLDSDASMASINGVVGTPAYMSPEQARGDSGRIGQSSDIYSLGAVLYEFLVGRPPLLADSAIETLRWIEEREPRSACEIQPDIALDLDTICMKCLRKDPADRYATAAELADDLDRYLQNRPILARPLPWIDRAVRWCSRNRRLAASLALSAILIVLTSIGGLWFGFEQSRLLKLANSATVEAQNRRSEAEAASRVAEASRAMAFRQRDSAVRVMDHATTELFNSVMIINSSPSLAPNPEAQRLRDQISHAFFQISDEMAKAEALEQEKPEYLCGLLFKTANIRRALGQNDKAHDLLLQLLDVYSRIPEPKRSLDGLTYQIIAARLVVGNLALSRNDVDAAIETWFACWKEYFGKGETWLRESKASRQPLTMVGRQLCEVLKKTGRVEELRQIELQLRQLERIQEEDRKP